MNYPFEHLVLIILYMLLRLITLLRLIVRGINLLAAYSTLASGGMLLFADLAGQQGSQLMWAPSLHFGAQLLLASVFIMVVSAPLAWPRHWRAFKLAASTFYEELHR